MAKPTIVTRAGKGSALTWVEGDANFTNLQNATFSITDGTGTVTNDLNSTLTLVPGANISLTFNDTSKSLTIDATAEDARIIAYNNTGVLIPKGSVVYISGSQGAHSTIALAKADAESTSAGTIGIVYADISSATTGYVQTTGVVKGVNTNGLTEGHLLYLSPSTAGAFTQTKPSAPNHVVTLGWVIAASSTAGRIQVKVDNGYELNELHNVSNATPSDNDVLKFISSTGLWTPSAGGSGGIASVSADTSPSLGGDLNVNSHAIVSTSNGNIRVEPNGSGNIMITPTTGSIILGATTWPNAMPTAGDILVAADSSGTLAWVAIDIYSAPGEIGSVTPNTGAFTTLTVSSANELRFNNSADTFYVGFKAGTLSASTIWTLPTTDGTSGQVLKTDGAGNLSWVTASGGGSTAGLETNFLLMGA